MKLTAILSCLVIFSLAALADAATVKIVAGGGTLTPTVDPTLQATEYFMKSPAQRVDRYGNIYVAGDQFSNASAFAGLIKINPWGHIENLVSDPRLNNEVSDICVDQVGNVYMDDLYQNVVYRITPNGTVELFAGIYGVEGHGGDGGPATAATLARPISLSVDLDGNVYIGCWNGTIIRKVDRSGIISTVMSTGTGATDTLYVDGLGNIYVHQSCTIKKLTPQGGVVNFAGTGVCGQNGDGGLATVAKLGQVQGMAMDDWGNLYFTDMFWDGLNNRARIRMVDQAGTISTVQDMGNTADPWSAYNRVSIDNDGMPYVSYTAPYSPSSDQIIKLIFPPTMYSFTPSSGKAGAVVTIKGRYFQSAGTGGKVTFNSTAAGILTWNNQVISCKVPNLSRGSYNVKVTTPDGQVSNIGTFTVK